MHSVLIYLFCSVLKCSLIHFFELVLKISVRLIDNLRSAKGTRRSSGWGVLCELDLFWHRVRLTELQFNWNSNYKYHFSKWHTKMEVRGVQVKKHNWGAASGCPWFSPGNSNVCISFFVFPIHIRLYFRNFGWRYRCPKIPTRRIFLSIITYYYYWCMHFFYQVKLWTWQPRAGVPDKREWNDHI